MACCDYLKKNLWQNIYVICLLMVIIIHFLFVTLLDFMRDETTDVHHVSSSEYVTMCSLLILEWFLIAFQCKVLYKYIFLTDIKPIFCLYLSKILAFADIYMLIFKISSKQFDHPNNILIAEKNYRDIAFVLLNYSASIQTLTGISAVTPRKVAAEFFSAIQVIFFGIGYSVFILSIAVLRFAQTDITNRKEYAPSPVNRIFNASTGVSPPFKHTSPNDDQNGSLLVSEVNPNMVPLGSINNTDNKKSEDAAHGLSLSSSKSFVQLLDTPRIKFIQNYLKYAKFFYRYMMLILICIQLPRLIIMYFVCDLNCENNAILTIGIVIDSLLLITTIISGIIRMRLIKTFGINVNVSVCGIIRSYLTILTQFGLLYFDIWLQTKHLVKSAFNVESFESDSSNFWEMFVHFIYFSTSTMTNVGSESLISTHEGLGQILNTLQMIMAVIFHTVVFGVSLLDISSHRIMDTEKYVNDHILSPSEDMKETNTLRQVGLIQRQIRQIVAAQQVPSDNNDGYSHPAMNNISISDDNNISNNE